MEVPLADE